MAKCSVCASKNRYAVDKLIAGGASNRAISRQFPEFSKDAIRRHRPHAADLIIDSQEKEDRRQGLALSSLLEDTVRDLRDLADDARTHEDYKAAASALGHVMRAAEILAKKPEEKPPGSEPKESGFITGYMKRAGEVYEKAQSPPPQ